MCNIAGIMIDSSIIDVDPDEFDRILGVNLKGVLYGCQAAGKVMVAQGGGSIINMSSTAVLAPSPGIGPYAICKAGVAQLTKSMAVEVGKKGVRVNSVAPGFVPTNMTARYYTSEDGTIDEAMKEAVLSPMARARTPAPGRAHERHRVLRAVSRFGRQQLRHGADDQPQRWRLHALLSAPRLRRRGGRRATRRRSGQADELELVGRRVRGDDGRTRAEQRDGGPDGHGVGGGARAGRCGRRRTSGTPPAGRPLLPLAPCSSTSGPAAVSATLSVTEPLNVPAWASEVAT